MQLKLKSVAVAAALALGIQGHAQNSTTLDALRDHKRVLLVFAGAHDPQVEQQWGTLADQRRQAADRDLVTVLLTVSRVKMHEGARPPEARFSAEEEQAARARFRVAPAQFTVILVGKDGGEKLRSHQPVAWQTLQDTIDAMPMRQAEMGRSR